MPVFRHPANSGVLKLVTCRLFMHARGLDLRVCSQFLRLLLIFAAVCSFHSCFIMATFVRCVKIYLVSSGCYEDVLPFGLQRSGVIEDAVNWTIYIICWLWMCFSLLLCITLTTITKPPSRHCIDAEEMKNCSLLVPLINIARLQKKQTTRQMAVLA